VEKGLLRFSAGWKGMLGYADEEIGSVQTIEEWEARIHPDDIERSRECIQAFVDEVTPPPSWEHRVRCKDGRWKWVLANGRVARRAPDGRPVRVAGALTDITRMKEMEEELLEAKELWTQLADSKAVLVYNNVEKNVMRLSRGWREMLGYPDDGSDTFLTYEELFARVHPEDFPGSLADLEASLSGTVPFLRTHFRLRCEDGSWKWVLSTGNVVRRAADGAPLRGAGTISDISHLKELEGKFRDLAETLQLRVEEETNRRIAQERLLAHQAKLAALGEMVSAIAHQWRQPLSTLAVAVQLIQEFYDLGRLDRPRLEEQVAESMRQITHMSNTIDEFRDFYRPDREPKVFDARERLHDSLRLGGTALGTAGIDVVENSEPGGAFPVLGFANDFKQAILNLLGNAADAIAERRSRGTPARGGRDVVEVAVRRTEGTIVVDIADNGCGVPSENRERIFEPLFTTKPEGKGTGLGLYMSRLLVEEGLGGSIVLHDRGNGGTVFRISVPEAPEAEAPDQGSGLNTVILLTSEPTPQA